VLPAELEYFASQEMSRNLTLEELGENGALEVGQLQASDVIVGREPEPSGIILHGKAVSRNHGIFSKVRNHWFYRDLGSTNGSWVNGVQTRPGEWRVIRPGMMLQLADVVVRIGAEGQDAFNRGPSSSVSALGGRSVFVFSGDEFIDEFLIPEYGRALMIGGAQADLSLEGDVFEEPSLVVERRGDKICAFSVAKEVQVLFNDQELKDMVNLSDGDSLKIGNYFILLNDPMRSRVVDPSAKHTMREWGSGDDGASGDANSSLKSRAVRPLGAFGQAPRDELQTIDQTIALDPDELDLSLQGAEMHPSMRYSIKSTGVPGFGSLEDRVILAIGAVLFMILVGLVAWWVLV